MKKRTLQKRRIAQFKTERNQLMNTNVEVCSFKVPLPRLNKVAFRTICHFACANYAWPLIKLTAAGETTSVENTLNVRTF